MRHVWVQLTLALPMTVGILAGLVFLPVAAHAAPDKVVYELCFQRHAVPVRLSSLRAYMTANVSLRAAPTIRTENFRILTTTTTDNFAGATRSADCRFRR
jgi:hypothetical protein